MRIPTWTFRMIAVAALIAAAPPADTRALPPPPVPIGFDGALSVMTYNVHGLPWPLAWGREADFDRIATTLRDMRAEGRNPHVVLLQEAFTDDARAIGRAAGYAYVADGPDDRTTNDARPAVTEQRFVAGESPLHGEGIGKYVGSGLQILSDFPIVAVHRMAFPRFACAGFDCLANKGAMLVRISLPGQPGPIDIVTTHLNSRRASDVPDARSNHAHSLQIASLTAFIRQWHDPHDPLIVGGDFNAGQAVERRVDLMDHAARDWSFGTPMDNAYAAAEGLHLPFSADARLSERRARDWEFFASGRQMTLTLRRIDIPFGHGADGTMLSDHVGCTATYALEPIDIQP
ncbi:endonuclease/exonuclease/phosphatase family protein [Sphingobium sp. PNB]|uniref:endonuclease/exonuclease/phosphatase family protein n=1 Tax=Sphingobium sp. PNB TaxID=863934 RepID=UPI001CA3D3A8|nr:endonuclease/exonuclease/phosphatase family protein [Sphingobium sp. PNB]MCB4859412.1 endonuclease/exonuclease/phosphatase family protein [Sphingobium sp. PNB]